MTDRLRVATRGSRLARWQAERVAVLLGCDVEFVVIDTTGDRVRDVDIHQLAKRERSEHQARVVGGVGGRGQGVFVKEVQNALLDGRADIAVHSAKDLPAETPEGLTIGAFPERGDARDALVGSRLDDIPTGGRVATGSVRRRAQLAAARPDLLFASLRGNIETRLRKAEDFDAIVMAYAALERLDLADRVAEVLEPSVMLPQVAQGALAVECRAGDAPTLAALTAIDRPSVRSTVVAERAFLAALGGGCDLPCGALAVRNGDHVRLEVLLASLDGRIVLRTTAEGASPERVGAEAAVALLDGTGGRSLLEGAA